MRHLLPIAIAMFATTSTAHAGETEVHARSMRLSWTEDIPGQSPIRERGTLVGIGVTRVEPLASPLYASATAELWGGRADYDGYRVDGWVPYSTDTRYLG